MKKLFTFLFLAGMVGWAHAQVTLFPWSEDLESWSTGGTFCNASQVLPNGWENPTGAQQDWTIDINGTGSFNTGPTANGGADYVPGTSGGKYLYVETSGCAFQSAHLVTPEFDSPNGLELTFGRHMFGASMGTLNIDVSTDNGVSWITSIVPGWSGNDGDIWNEETISFATYAGTPFRVRFNFTTGSSFTSDVSLDGFEMNILVDDDAGVTSLTQPASPKCVLDSIIIATIVNTGVLTLNSVEVHHAIAGIPQPVQNLTGLGLASGQDTVFTVSTIAPYGFGDLVEVWTEMPNGVVDLNPLNDSADAQVETGLSGTYTVGPTVGNDFVTIQDAVNDLLAFGVCGHVIMNFDATSFSEQITITEIPGSDMNNTVTFRSVTGDATQTTWTSSTAANATNWTLNMDGVDWVTIKELTLENTNTLYGRVIKVGGGATNNTLEDAIVRNNNATTTSNFSVLMYSNNGNDDNWTITGNTFENGSYGIDFWGNSQTSLETGTIIEDNDFINQYWYGLRTYYQDGTKVNGNHMSSNSIYTGTSYAIDIWYNDGGIEVTDNIVDPSGNTWPTYGLRVYYNDNTSANRGLIANNCIRIGNATNTFTSFYGYYGFQNGFQDIVHNSFDVKGGGTFARSIYSSSGGANTLSNNNISMEGQGYAVYLQDNYTIINSDYNNIYADNGFNNYVWQGGAVYADLAAWQAGSNFDLNSFTVMPDYNQDSTCILCQDTLDGAANPNSLVTSDYLGNVRSTSSPDIGASEFTGVANFSLGIDPIFCGGAGTLDAGPVQSAIWSTGETTNSINITTSGTYNVSILTDCGPATSSVVATVVPVPDLGPDMHICANQTANLDATVTGAPSYMWSTNMNDTNATVTAGMAGTYVVTVTNDGCVDVDTVNITQSQAVVLPADAEACEGNTVDLDATIQDGLVYTWTPAFSGAVNTVSTTGVYSVVVTDANGCVSNDTTNFISVDNPPVAQFTSFLNYLTGTFLNTTQTNGNNTYLWDFGDNTTSTIENPVHVYPWTSQPQVYIVSLTVTNQCGTSTVTEQISISVGIDENIAENGFSFYPNPNNGRFTLLMKDANYNSTVMDIVDLQGRVVYTQDFGSVNGELTKDIQINDIAKGIYVIRMTLDDEVKVSKLNVQ